jgi:hypothetical protein
MRPDPNRLAFLALLVGIVLAVTVGGTALRRAGGFRGPHRSAPGSRQPLPDRVPRPMIDPAWKTGLLEAIQGSRVRLVELENNGGAGVRAVYAGPPDALLAVLARLERKRLPFERVWIGPLGESAAAGLQLRVEVGSRSGS